MQERTCESLGSHNRKARAFRNSLTVRRAITACKVRIPSSFIHRDITNTDIHSKIDREAVTIRVVAQELGCNDAALTKPQPLSASMHTREN